MHTLIPNPDLAKLNSYHKSQELLAKINNKRVDLDLKISDIVDNWQLIDSWQNECFIIRKAKEVLINEQDAPNNLRKVGTLINNQECKLFNGCLVRYDRDLVNEKLMKIILPEEYKSQVAIALHNTFGHGSVSRLANSAKRLFQLKTSKTKLAHYVINVRIVSD